MKNKVEKTVVVLTIIIGFGIFLFWFFYNPVKDFAVNEPGLDKRPLKDTNSRQEVIIGEKFKEYAKSTSTLTGKWTRFRGADFDNINKEKIALVEKWGKEGPKILWKTEMLGEGHAAPVIYNGKAYILDYDERKKNDALRCFSLETGTELWRRWYNINLKRNHGMSRTIPAITDKYIVTIGPKCQVMCCNPETGDFLWGIDLEKNYKTEVPLWYTGQCPLIDNNIAVIAPGGTSLLIGVDCATGKVVWQTPNPDKLKMSHSSVMPMTVAGKKMYVYMAVGGLVGVSAEGADVGKLLWKTNKFNPSVIAPSPLYLGNNKIYITAGYGAGAAIFEIVRQGESFSANVVKNYKPNNGLASEQQTPILYNNYLFALLPKDAGERRNQFVCSSVNNTQNILWTSEATDRYGLGPYIIADGKFFILNDDGTLTIAKLSTSKFTILDRAKIIDGQDSWGPLALADGLLLMRDSKQMVCVDLRKKS
jgi:outer membrane protein assembly factor BamB